MLSLEHYTDYRHFLKDYYIETKKRFPHFSYRYFCRKAGIKSPAFYSAVVRGERNLTAKTIAQFARGLELDQKQEKFFTVLVHFTQARSAVQKQEYLEQMRSLLPRVKEQTLAADYYAYYSKWYNLAIRELACIIDWRDNYQLLADRVQPRITRMQAREACLLLAELGLIEKTGDGRYRQTKMHLTTGSEVSSLAIRKVNQQFAWLAGEAIERVSPVNRDMSSLVIGISHATYEQIKQEIQLFKDRIKILVVQGNEPDAVYTMNVHLFPLSREPEKRIELL